MVKKEEEESVFVVEGNPKSAVVYRGESTTVNSTDFVSQLSLHVNLCMNTKGLLIIRGKMSFLEKNTNKC